LRERLAQAQHVNIDGALFDEHVVAPDAVEQLGAREHALGMAQEVPEQLELRQAHLDRLAVDQHLVARRIDRQGTVAERLAAHARVRGGETRRARATSVRAAKTA
jgi:acyl CoA:acetate/3-ketoacid CoA transferase